MQTTINKCNKVCLCSKCENHGEAFITFRDDTNPFSVVEMTVKGYKCGRYAQYNTTCGLQGQPVFTDDLITGDLAKKHIEIERKY